MVAAGQFCRVLLATAAAVATEDSVAVATEAGDEKDPDNPFASAVAAHDTATSAVAIVVGIVAVAAEQKQDNPNPAAAPVIIS